MQNELKSNLGKISRERYKLKEQRSELKILNCFAMEKLLLNYLVVIFNSISG